MSEKNQEAKVPKLPIFTAKSSIDGSMVRGNVFIEFRRYFIIDEFSNKINVLPHTIKLYEDSEWYTDHNWKLINDFAEHYEAETEGKVIPENIIESFFNA